MSRQTNKTSVGGISMFYDLVKIKIKAGDGGNGIVSFRREKFIAKGGPDGGDGGGGGSVFFKVNPNLGTLAHFNAIKNFKSESGTAGGKQDKKGKTGEDLILEVPQGTMVYDEETNELLFDLTEKEEIIEVAKGGRGGFGNAHFKTAKNQAPSFAELGEPGEEKELRLELKLIADVAIIGIPSVGKSTLISVISNAKPKIADYPFTTIVPNLGVISVDDFSFVAVDVPGLIEGAYKGKGLGDAFLRHIERSRIIVHLLDITSEDIISDYNILRKELQLFNPILSEKPEIISVNKIDAVNSGQLTVNKQEIKDEFRKITKKPVFFISAVTKEGIPELLYEIVRELKYIPRPVFVKEKLKVFRPQEKLLRNFKITKEKDVFTVSGARIERIASQTDPENPEALARLYKVLESAELIPALIKAGIKEGHTIKLGRRTSRFKDGKILVIS